MTVDLQHAETHLPELIAAAEAGEDVVIATGGQKAVKLVVTHSPVSKQRDFGRLKDKLNLPENWEAEWERMGEELTMLMTEAPLCTNGE